MKGFEDHKRVFNEYYLIIHWDLTLDSTDLGLFSIKLKGSFSFLNKMDFTSW